MLKIRESLQNIIDRKIGLNENGGLDKQIEDIITCSNIKVYEKCKPDDLRNCTAYSLGISKAACKSWYKRRGKNQIQNNLVRGKEIRLYRSLGFLELLIGSSELGNLIIYFNKEEITHSGILLSSGKIKSKWGCIPAIFEHEIWEVPKSYGEDIKFYFIVDKVKLKTLIKDRNNPLYDTSLWSPPWEYN